MTIGTPYVDESIAVAVGNGQHQQMTAAQVSTLYGAGNVKTPTAHFSIPVGPNLVTCRKNLPIVKSPELSAALTAAGAPVV